MTDTCRGAATAPAGNSSRTLPARRPVPHSIDDSRFQIFQAAVADEQRRFNRALDEGAVVILPTVYGMFQVVGVADGWWYELYPLEFGSGGIRPPAGSAPRRLKGANNRVWRDFLDQAGVERHPHLRQFPWQIA